MATLTLKSTTVQDFFDGFVNIPEKIQGQPGYSDLCTLRKHLSKNAAAINSTLGGGNHGHLGLVLQPATYLTVTGTAFTRPAQPTLVLPPNASGPAIAQLTSRYQDDLRAFRELQNLEAALIRQVQHALEPLYLRPLELPYVGLLGKSLQHIMRYLFNAYGRISEKQLLANRTKLVEPYHVGSQPFQILIDRFQTAAEFADDGNLPITNAELVSAGLAALKTGNHIPQEIKEWKQLPDADRDTFAKFAAFFQPHILEYQQANNDENQTPNLPAAFGHHLGGAAPVDKTLTDWMTQQQDQLSQSMMAMAANAANQQNIMDKLLQGQALAAQGAPAAAQPPARRPFVRQDHGSYCHSHGYLVAKTHTSVSCKKPKPGHRTDATRENNMGGNQEGKPTT